MELFRYSFSERTPQADGRTSFKFSRCSLSVILSILSEAFIRFPASGRQVSISSASWHGGCAPHPWWFAQTTDGTQSRGDLHHCTFHFVSFFTQRRGSTCAGSTGGSLFSRSLSSSVMKTTRRRTLLHSSRASFHSSVRTVHVVGTLISQRETVNSPRLFAG